jgi:hypothetical protein
VIRVFCLALLIAFTMLPAARASGTCYGGTCYPSTAYADGTVDGCYTYRGGYWWHGDNAYTRAYVSYTYYAPAYVNGCYYPNYLWTGYRWQYTYHHTREYCPPAPRYERRSELPTPKTHPTNWRAALLDIAANRDKVEGELRKSAVEHNEFLEATQALGLTGNFRWGGYGAEPIWPRGYRLGTGYGYGAGNDPGTYQFHAQGFNGNTVYGYSTQTAADLYGSTDVNALYQQAAKLAQGAQGLAEQATKDHGDRVAQIGNNQARVAEILARAAAAREVFQATAPPAEAKVRSQTQGAVVMPKAVDAPAAEPLAQWQAHATAKCAGCHGKSDNHGFDVSTYPSMDFAGKSRVWNYLLAKNPDKRCPKNEDGSPGQPLTQADLKLWFAN